MAESIRKSKSVLTKIIFIFILLVVITVIMVVFKAGSSYYSRWQNKQALLHLAKAEGLALNNKYAEAVAEYRIITDKYPHHPLAATAWYRIGAIYVRNLNNNALARAAFETLLEKYPQFPLQYEARYYLLLIYERLKEDKELIKISQEILDKFPGKMDADSLYLEKAEAYFRQGNLEEAYHNVMKMKNKNSPLIKFSQKYHQILIAHNPADPQPHYALAAIYGKINLKAKSESEMRIADYLKQRQQPGQRNEKPKSGQ